MTPHPIHTTLIQTDGPHRVTVEPSDDGRWFRVLNWLIDSHIWAALTDAQRAVLIVIHRHRRHDGTATIPVDTLQSQAGLSRRGVYNALQGLKSHPAGLLAQSGSETWIPLPDREFAGRLVSPPPVHPHARLRIPVHSECIPVHNASIDRVRGDLNPETRRPRPDRTVCVRPVPAPIGDDDERIRLLTGGGPRPKDRGFTPEAARSILASTGASLTTVRDAVRNAAYKAERGELSRWQGYVATQIRNGCALFEPIQAIDDQVQRVDERLRRLVAEFADEQQAQTVTRWFAGMAMRDRARAISKAAAGLPDAELWPKVLADALGTGRRT